VTRKKKLRGLAKSSLLEQVREARLAHFEEEKQELHQPYLNAKAAYQAKREEIQARQNDDPDAYTVMEDGTHWKPDSVLLNEYQEEMKDWVTTPEALALKAARDEAWRTYTQWNDENHPGNPRESAEIRKRYQKKSKKNVKARIEVTDRDVFCEQLHEQQVDVEWPSWLAVGSLVQTKKGTIGIVVDERTYDGYRDPDAAVKRSGLVQLMIDGNMQWHNKITLRPLDD
jgi:hypothetical protein